MACGNSGSITRGEGRTLKHSSSHNNKSKNMSKGQYKKPGLLLMKNSYGKPVKYHHELCIPSWVWWLIAAIVILAIILIVAL